jgi:hypothetical protein
MKQQLQKTLEEVARWYSVLARAALTSKAQNPAMHLSTAALNTNLRTKGFYSKLVRRGRLHSCGAAVTREGRVAQRLRCSRTHRAVTRQKHLQHVLEAIADLRCEGEATKKKGVK